jgi:hypothetical protein
MDINYLNVNMILSCKKSSTDHNVATVKVSGLHPFFAWMILGVYPAQNSAMPDTIVYMFAYGARGGGLAHSSDADTAGIFLFQLKSGNDVLHYVKLVDVFS